MVAVVAPHTVVFRRVVVATSTGVASTGRSLATKLFTAAIVSGATPIGVTTDGLLLSTAGRVLIVRTAPTPAACLDPRNKAGGDTRTSLALRATDGDKERPGLVTSHGVVAVGPLLIRAYYIFCTSLSGKPTNTL